MSFRLITAALVAIACSACANERSTRVLGYQGSAASIAPITTAAAAPAPQDGQMRKTLASKVLAARALERVTGRKPDPARFASLD
jgi:hypothetical protein